MLLPQPLDNISLEMENQGRNLVKDLIADRKERLNSIQADSTAKELLDIIHNGFFLHDPLRKVDQEAIKDNAETDKLMQEWAWERIDLPYCIENGIAF